MQIRKLQIFESIFARKLPSFEHGHQSIFYNPHPHWIDIEYIRTYQKVFNAYPYYGRIIIVTIMSCRQHGYPWPSLATSPYHSSLLAGLQGYIPYPHIAAVCMFELVVLLLLGHMQGSIGVHHWWSRLWFSSSVLRVWFVLLCFDLLTRPKMPFKVMHRKEVTHSNGSYERKSRGRKLADEMGRGKKKIPWYSDRLMHRKRVTSELHDSYFRLMTIKHSISKIEWASNDYIIQLSSTSQ